MFLQPYKLIVALDAKIRQRLEDLESKWANYPETSSKAALDKSDSGSTAAWTSREAFVDGKREHPPKDPTNSLDALQDLRCLVEFIDNDIMPVSRMYRSGPDFYKQIAFRNMWYLFKPGDDVDITVGRGSEPDIQSIWRVLHVSEGCPHLSENSKKMELINPFKLLSFKIGYNGNSFGPITHFFEIPAFEGRKYITSLDIILMRMVEDPKVVKDQWQNLGLKFKTFTVPQHQIYLGSTLSHHTNGERCINVQRTENVNGSVIIDIKAAVRDDEQWAPEIGDPEAFLWRWLGNGRGFRNMCLVGPQRETIGSIS